MDIDGRSKGRAPAHSSRNCPNNLAARLTTARGEGKHLPRSSTLVTAVPALLSGRNRVIL
jgi:hypothetical protein